MSIDDNGPLPRLSNCPTCAGMGWVCEEHMDQPWEHEGCGGAGAACMCNPTRYVGFSAVLAGTPEEDDERTSTSTGSSGDPAGLYLGRRGNTH